jgi:hypothetical protein
MAVVAKFDSEGELAWLGLRSRFREVTREVVWCLRGDGVALCVRAVDPAVKSDRATDLRKPGLWGLGF